LLPNGKKLDANTKARLSLQAHGLPGLFTAKLDEIYRLFFYLSRYQDHTAFMTRPMVIPYIVPWNILKACSFLPDLLEILIFLFLLLIS